MQSLLAVCGVARELTCASAADDSEQQHAW